MKCPKCGFADAAGKFCSECGGKLAASAAAAAPAPVAPAAPTEELKTATILFADVSGFTAMSEKLSAEECAAIMKSCFTALEQAIQDYQGTVIKYVGDCIMASFGVPITIEDHPVRAVFAAREMQKRLRKFSQQLEAERGFTLRMRIGLNVGEVWVGSVGGKLDLMGTTVNLASRLEHDCKIGGILINDSVYRVVEAMFACTVRAPFHVKGISEAVTAYEVDEEKRIKVSSGRRALESPKLYVGRSEALLALKRQVKQLLDGVGSGVVIVGDAGVGKTRLIQELHQQVAFRNLPWMEVESASYRQNIPYASVVTLLEHFFSISDDDTEEVIMAKIGESLVEIEEFYLASDFHKTDPDKRNRISLGEQKRLLTELLIDASSGGSGRQLAASAHSTPIAKAVRQLFRQAALHSKGLVVVCDNVQGADTFSQEALEGLLRLGEEIPLLAITMYRTDAEASRRFTYDRADARAVETEGNIKRVRAKDTLKFRGTHRFVEIKMPALSEEESAQLVAAWLQVEQVSPELQTFVQGKAGGNPYFIEEVINSLVEERALVRGEDGQWRLKEQALESMVPESLREMTAARIDRLGRDFKHTLQLAAVIGQQFSATVLKHIHQQKDEVETQLRSLVKEGLLKQAAPGDFTFAQPIIQEVAYNTMLQRDRSVYHGQVAQVLEEGASPTTLEGLTAVLGWHYVRAGAGYETKAALYGLKAAEAAFLRGDMAEAHNLGTSLLETVSRARALTGEDLGRLHFLLGQSHSYLGKLDDGLKHLEKARDLLADPNARADTERELGLIHAKRADYDSSEQWLNTAEKTLRAIQPLPGASLARLLVNHAWLSMRRHHHKQAEQYCGEVLRLLKKDIEASTVPGLLAKLWNTLGDIHLGRRDPEGALEQYQKTLELHDQRRRSLERVAALRGTGQALQLKGETEQAHQTMLRALALAEEIGNPLALGDTLLAMAQFHLWRGDLTATEADLGRSLKVFESMGDRLGQAGALSTRAEVALRQGELPVVIEAAQEAQRLYAVIGDAVGEVWARLTTARAYADQGQFFLAEELGQEALSVADHTETAAPQADARLFLGELALMRKQYAEAEAMFSGAHLLAQEAADRLLIARTRLAWGGLHLLGDEAEWPEAQQAVEEALNIFQELGEARGIRLARLFLADWRLRRQEWDLADRLLQALLTSIGDARIKERGKALMGRSQACLGRGQVQDARQLADQALELFESAGMEIQVSRTLLYLAPLYEQAGEQGKADEVRKRGTSIRERLTADESGSKVELLLRSLRREGIGFLKSMQGYELQVTVPGRADHVNVELFPDRQLPGGGTGLLLVRPLEKAQEARFKEMLMGNMWLAHGAVGLWDNGGVEYFALFETLMVDNLTRDELQAAIGSLARGGEKWVRKERTEPLAAPAPGQEEADGQPKAAPKESAADRAKREREHKLVRMVDEAVKGTAIKFTISPVGNTLSVPVDSGRIRAVTFIRNRLDQAGRELLVFTTRGGAAAPEAYRSNLLANAQMGGGGIGLQSVGGSDTFMIAESLVAQFTSGPEIVQVINGLALLGDQLEKGKIQKEEVRS